MSATPPPKDPRPAPDSAWAPLGARVFRALWIAQLVSNIGSWMQSVGAQWLLIGHDAALVTLVQTASSLPVVLLALPSGVLADRSDRRRVLLAAQFAMLAVSTVLAVLAFADALTPQLLLGLTFLLGCGTALMGPAWQAIQPELVERRQLGQAAALGAVNMNLARALGPALGGAVVAAAGAGWVFAFNAASYLGIAAVLMLWRRPPTQTPTAQGERLLTALYAGRRYVWYAPGVRRVLLRTVLFIPGGAALWSLLPLIASRSLGLGSGGYGLLLGAVGVGAVGGAFVLPAVRRALGANGTLAAGAVVFAGVLAVLATVRIPWLAVVVLLPAGLAWIGVLSTLNAALQTRLPGWVRARGLAVYLLVFQGGQALAAPVWGALAGGLGLTVSLLAGSGLLLVGAVSVRRWPVRPLARSAPGVRARTGRRPRAGLRHVPGRPREQVRLHRLHGSRGPFTSAHGSPHVGALPGRQRPGAVRRELPGRLVVGASRPAPQPTHDHRPPLRGAGPQPARKGHRTRGDPCLRRRRGSHGAREDPRRDERVGAPELTGRPGGDGRDRARGRQRLPRTGQHAVGFPGYPAGRCISVLPAREFGEGTCHPLIFAGNPGLQAGRECDPGPEAAKRRSSLRGLARSARCSVRGGCGRVMQVSAEGS
jgi:predicted MFS family arabinose efflux permease